MSLLNVAKNKVTSVSANTPTGSVDAFINDMSIAGVARSLSKNRFNFYYTETFFVWFNSGTKVLIGSVYKDYIIILDATVPYDITSVVFLEDLVVGVNVPIFGSESLHYPATISLIDGSVRIAPNGALLVGSSSYVYSTPFINTTTGTPNFITSPNGVQLNYSSIDLYSLIPVTEGVENNYPVISITENCRYVVLSTVNSTNDINYITFFEMTTPGDLSTIVFKNVLKRTGLTQIAADIPRKKLPATISDDGLYLYYISEITTSTDNRYKKIAQVSSTTPLIFDTTTETVTEVSSVFIFDFNSFTTFTMALWNNSQNFTVMGGASTIATVAFSYRYDLKLTTKSDLTSLTSAVRINDIHVLKYYISKYSCFFPSFYSDSVTYSKYMDYFLFNGYTTKLPNVFNDGKTHLFNIQNNFSSPFAGSYFSFAFSNNGRTVYQIYLSMTKTLYHRRYDLTIPYDIFSGATLVFSDSYPNITTSNVSYYNPSATYSEKYGVIYRTHNTTTNNVEYWHVPLLTGSDRLDITKQTQINIGTVPKTYTPLDIKDGIFALPPNEVSGGDVLDNFEIFTFSPQGKILFAGNYIYFLSVPFDLSSAYRCENLGTILASKLITTINGGIFTNLHTEVANILSSLFNKYNNKTTFMVPLNDTMFQINIYSFSLVVSFNEGLL